MARLRFCFESHLLIVLCHNFPKESLCLFAYAFSSFCVGHSPSIVFFTVFAKSNLPNNTFKQVLDIMMKSSWGLNEFAVKHNGTGPSLCMEREKVRWVEMDIFSSYILAEKWNKNWLWVRKVPSMQHGRKVQICTHGFAPYSPWFYWGMVRNLSRPIILNIRQQ